MIKIKCVFAFNDRHRVIDQVNPGCEWVLAGEGIATRKFDGTSCLVRGGQLLKRYDAKNGKTPPPGWEPCQPAPDETTGHWPGWMAVGDAPEDWMHRLAPIPAEDGTYELCGPKMGRNAERLDSYVLIKHASTVLDVPVRTFDGMRDYLEGVTFEGVVFHHPDGRMAKLRRHDYGFKYPVEAAL